MGFLEAGTPLLWEDSMPYLQLIREHGIVQFLQVFNKVKLREGDVLKWGDEIEYHVVDFNAEAKEVKVTLTAPAILEALENEEKETDFEIKSSWHPEYGSWMVEATPGGPYGSMTSDLGMVEANMAMRRRRIQAVLPPNQAPLSIVAFPLLGVGDYTLPPTVPGGRHAASAYISDSVISPHPRFGTLTENIRTRRGSHVCICLPLFPDERTDMTEGGPACGAPPAAPAATTPAGAGAGDSPALGCDRLHCGTECVPGTDGSTAERVVGASDRAGSCTGPTGGVVHMDAMAFGMGCCCLQVTFQAKNLAESLYLYDQLSVVSPIVMALSAASPMFKGRLVDTDTRWDVIASSVDCRTPEERGLPPDRNPSWMAAPEAAKSAGGARRRIHKSRYDTIDCYLSSGPNMKPQYNDIPLVYDEASYAQLVEGGVDDALARHIAHLFIRDPLVIFSERTTNDPAVPSTEHFENIQSTNWQNVRWKPPPPDAKDMGWRVELRTMEVQLTDFENAAFTVFSVLLSRVILFFNLNLYIPISKVDENMACARLRGAITTQKFYFRKHVVPLEDKCPVVEPLPEGADPDEYTLLSCEEILMGTGPFFPGLIPLIFAYLDIIKCNGDTRALVEQYLQLIVDRSRGHLPTNATWLRDLVTSHPAYNKDSVITQEIAHDVLAKCRAVSDGSLPAPELVGEFTAGHNPSKRTKDRRLRGASFQDKVFTTQQCTVVRGLVAHYTIGKTFASTPAFLRFPVDEEDEEEGDDED